MSISGDVQYMGDIMSKSGCSVHLGFQEKLKGFINLLPHMHLDIPRCTEHPLMYSWYPSNVLNTSRCTEHPPMY